MRIVIIEDAVTVQKMLKAAFAEVPGFTVLAVAESCVDALEAVKRHRPDAVVLDLSLRDGSSIPIISQLLASCPALFIVVFSLGIDPLIQKKVLDAGAHHCFDKREGPDNVVNALLSRRGGTAAVAG